MTWHSQAGQDEWVIEQHGDTPGYFVDVGAHDGIVHSNTYALEQLGWTGLCIEPNHSAYSELAKNRSCALREAVVSDSVGTALFDGVRVGGGESRLCWTLRALLPDPDPDPDPDDPERVPVPVIDYLSIDVEGHELEVLAGMDFDRWHVRLLTVEHNLYCDGPDRKNAIYDRLTGHGFERVREDVVAPGYGEYEDWYRHVEA